MFRARLLDIELFEPSSIAFIFDVVRQAAEKLESATMDPTHTINLHAGLLRSILNSTPRTSPSPSRSSSNGQPIFHPPPPDLLDLPTHPTTLLSSPDTDPPSPFLSSSSRPLQQDRASTPDQANPGMVGPGGLLAVGPSFVDTSGFVGEGGWGGEFNWLEGGMVEHAHVGELDFSLFDFRPPN